MEYIKMHEIEIIDALTFCVIKIMQESRIQAG